MAVSKSRLTSEDCIDSEWKVCGLHIEYAAFLLALAGIGIDILAILFAFYISKWYIAVFAFFFLVINSTVLCAKSKRHRFCYCPYLISNVFGLLLCLGMIVLMTYNISELPEWWMQWVDPIKVRETRNNASYDKIIWTTAVILAFFIAYFLIYAFFQYVIWKAYKFMKRYPHGEAQKITTIQSHDQGRLITNGANNMGNTVVTIEDTSYIKKI